MKKTGKQGIVREVAAMMFEIHAVTAVRTTPEHRDGFIGNASLFAQAALHAIEAAAEALSPRNRAGTYAARSAMRDLREAADRIRNLSADCGFGCTPATPRTVVETYVPRLAAGVNGGAS